MPLNANPRRLADILSRGQNNFDLIRLIAALSVIFGHSFYLFETGGFREPVTQLVQRNFTGTLAVGVFFFISGILISQSFQRLKDPLGFAILRIARIYPGAIVCLLATVFFIGPLVTALPIGQYLRSGDTLGYLRGSLSFPPGGQLPGVFTHNHGGATPNGALWTLQPELICYAYVLVLGCLGCLKSTARILITLAALVALHAAAPHWVPYFSDDRYSDLLKVGLFFIAGVSAYALRDVLVLRSWFAVPLVVVAALLQNTALQEYALYAALFYCVLLIASSEHLRGLKLPGDYSFGVYIYGYPIQQTVEHFLPNLTSYPSNLICMPAALVAGILSWTLIERPILSRAHRFVATRGTDLSIQFARSDSRPS